MWSFVLLASAVVACVSAHGRVFEPPSRSSAWRFGFPTPADYDDDGANCGGFSMQHATNGGKCGICGDAYNIAPPRPHELGGTYGLGLIVAHYPSGSLMTTTVDLTTSHRGFWEFKLCPDPESNDQACFDQHVLSTEDGETKYYPNQGSTKYNVTYRLPSGLVCEHCVLQWRYTAGNNWGICANGSSGLGCGPQEQFLACSDISIGTTKSSVRDGAQSDIPAPLLYYLKNGYFDAQQGILHLLRGTARPNVVGSSHNTRQQSQRPVQPSVPRGQPPQSTQQRPTQQNQRPIQQNQKPTQQNQKPAQQNQHQRPAQTIQRVHPNQITPQNNRPSQNVQTNHKLVKNPQKGLSPHHEQQNQQFSKSQKLIQHPVKENQDKLPPSSYQYQEQTFQAKQQDRQHNTHNHHSIQVQHPIQVQNLIQQSGKSPTQLEALVQKHRDEQKQLGQPQKSVNIPNSRPVTIQITTHTVHSYKVPLKPQPGPNNLQQWKKGKAAQYKKSSKKKRRGKLRKRKKKMPFEEYNRIIKVGTW